jgi:hypothetical protein
LTRLIARENFIILKGIDSRVDVRISNWILKKQGIRMWIVFIWLRIGTSNEIL